MPKTLALLVLVAASLLAAAGCAWSPTIRSDYDTTVRFEDWTTWAWAPQSAEVGVGAVSASLHDARIRRSVESTLAARGYRQVRAEDADFLLAYRVLITSEADVTVWDDPDWGYRWRRNWRPTHVSVHRYEMGSLILDVIQRRTGDIAWRGWAEAEVNRSTAPEERDRRIDVAVQMIFDRFPPR